MSDNRYQPRASGPWPVCSVCGLASPDVKGSPPKCPDAKRCVRVVTKHPNNKQNELYPDHLQPKPEDEEPKASA